MFINTIVLGWGGGNKHVYYDSPGLGWAIRMFIIIVLGWGEETIRMFIIIVLSWEGGLQKPPPSMNPKVLTLLPLNLKAR